MSRSSSMSFAGVLTLLLAAGWSCGSDDEESDWPYGSTGGTSGAGGSQGGTGGAAGGAAGGSGGTAGGSGADGGSGGTTDGGSGGTTNGGSGGTTDGGSGGTTDGGSGGTTNGGSGGTSDGGTGGGAGAAGAGGGSASCDTAQHTGVATYYDADGSGNCSFDPSPGDLMVGAMNHVDYADSAVCGTCVHVVGPQGEVTVRIVDQCPGCNEGHIDLSPQAFAEIAEIQLGIVDIQWRYVPCDVQGPVVYHFKDGSNQWWTAVQIRNHRHQIATVEYLDGGTYKNVPRLSYNYFVEASGMGPGPYTFRLTDIYGGTVEDSGITHVENGDVTGGGQFPPCQ